MGTHNQRTGETENSNHDKNRPREKKRVNRKGKRVWGLSHCKKKRGNKLVGNEGGSKIMESQDSHEDSIWGDKEQLAQQTAGVHREE